MIVCIINSLVRVFQSNLFTHVDAVAVVGSTEGVSEVRRLVDDGVPLVAVLSRGRIDRFVEIHAADVYVSVRVSDCREDDITLAGAIVAERRGQVRREFFEGSQDSVVSLVTKGPVPSRLDIASIGVVFQVFYGSEGLIRCAVDGHLERRYLRFGT